MKKMLLLAALTYGPFTINAQTISKGLKGSAVNVIPTLIVQDQMDLGEMDGLKDTEFELRFVNTGTAPITVRKVSTTEFITVKDFTKVAVPPGGEGVVRLQHRPDAAGDFLEMVVIESDAVNAMAITKVYGSIAQANAGRRK
jgi:hypothetical protein